MHDNAAGVDSVGQNFFGWLRLNAEEGQALFRKANEDHMDDVVPGFQVLFVSAAGQFQLAALWIVDVGHEVGDQVVDVQPVVFLVACEILVGFFKVKVIH